MWRKFSNFLLLSAVSLFAQTTYGQQYLFTTLPAPVDGAPLFDFAESVAVDGAGNVYVADANNRVIRKITPARVVSTLAGLPGFLGHDDGKGDMARFGYIYQIGADGDGNVYAIEH